MSRRKVRLQWRWEAFSKINKSHGEGSVSAKAQKNSERVIKKNKDKFGFKVQVTIVNVGTDCKFYAI